VGFTNAVLHHLVNSHVTGFFHHRKSSIPSRH
jgi:hypothetical protein